MLLSCFPPWSWLCGIGFLDCVICFLDVALLCEAEISIILHADNQVLMNGNSDDFSGLNNSVCDVFVRCRWGKVAGWVIMPVSGHL
jgi:hypothetical protein